MVQSLPSSPTVYAKADAHAADENNQAERVPSPARIQDTGAAVPSSPAFRSRSRSSAWGTWSRRQA
eukprot:7740107-Pyramimonas_sp.AAC.1